MLGIYKPAWEFIREDTFTNAESATHTITEDKDGKKVDRAKIIATDRYGSRNEKINSKRGQIKIWAKN